MADSNVHPSNPLSTDVTPESMANWSPEQLTSEWDQLEKALSDATNEAHHVRAKKAVHEGEPSEEHDRLNEVMAKVTAVRQYWRRIGEVTGTRTFVAVQDNVDQ